MSIAEKKCKEILGGKTILNSINDEPTQKKTILGFKIDNQTGFLNRNHNDFQNYRLVQISIVEDSRDNNWKENLWSSNPYDNNKSIENSPKIKVNEIIQNNLIKREHKVFENLIIEQIFLAENIRNEILGFRITDVQNPYLNKDIDENVNKNVEESSIKTNTNMVIGWSDPTYVTDKPEFNIIDRNAEGFEMVKAMELEIAQKTLNEILMLSNSEKDDVKIIILTNENKKLNNYKQNDKGFEFFKNKQIDIAEQKLIKILGGKTITNVDFKTKDKIVVIPELTKREKIELINKNYEIFRNYNLVLFSIPDKIRAENTNGHLWDLNWYIIDENNSVKQTVVDENNSVKQTVVDENNSVKQTVVDKNIGAEKPKQGKTVGLCLGSGC